jgi:hypothetical protein
MGFLIDAVTQTASGLSSVRMIRALQNLAEIIVRTYYSAGSMQACR